MNIGDKVVMTSDAVDNYGNEWNGVVLVITHKADKYMPANEFFAKGKPEGYHPGYDESSGCNLYDLKTLKGDGNVPFSLYDWELETL